MALTLEEPKLAAQTAQVGFDETYDRLLKSFQKSQQPQPINFRELVSLPGYPERATHLIHSYPAKLLAHIPYFFLSNERFTQAGDKVFDPFCGTGTVLLESLLFGRSAVGIDANPLAVSISRAKNSKLDFDSLTASIEHLEAILQGSPVIEHPLPDVINLEYWFTPRVIRELNHIKSEVLKFEDADIKNFLLISFSALLRRVSLADPTVSVPVRLNPERFASGSQRRKKAERFLEEIDEMPIQCMYLNVARTNVARMKSLEIKGTASVETILGDSRCIKLAPDSVDLIITSPPYAGAQKYIRASSLNIGWLGLEKSEHLRNLDRISVGREQFTKVELESHPDLKDAYSAGIVDAIKKSNPLRAKLVAEYLFDLRKSLSGATYALKRGKYAVIVIGNSTTCGLTLETDRVIKSIMSELGMEIELHLIDDIKSRGLMTKRNKTAGLISQEHILVFKKG